MAKSRKINRRSPGTPTPRWEVNIEIVVMEGEFL
jgi:hypothetical protein